MLYLILNIAPPLLLSVFFYFGVTPKLTRWKVDLGRLMAIASSGALRVRDFRNQLGLRHRFGEAFKEAVDALEPNALLILVDDLDRMPACAVFGPDDIGDLLHGPCRDQPIQSSGLFEEKDFVFLGHGVCLLMGRRQAALDPLYSPLQV